MILRSISSIANDEIGNLFSIAETSVCIHEILEIQHRDNLLGFDDEIFHGERNTKTRSIIELNERIMEKLREKALITSLKTGYNCTHRPRRSAQLEFVTSMKLPLFAHQILTMFALSFLLTNLKRYLRLCAVSIDSNAYYRALIYILYCSLCINGSLHGTDAMSCLNLLHQCSSVKITGCCFNHRETTLDWLRTCFSTRLKGLWLSFIHLEDEDEDFEVGEGALSAQNMLSAMPQLEFLCLTTEAMHLQPIPVVEFSDELYQNPTVPLSNLKALIVTAPNIAMDYHTFEAFWNATPCLEYLEVNYISTGVGVSGQSFPIALQLMTKDSLRAINLNESAASDYFIKLIAESAPYLEDLRLATDKLPWYHRTLLDDEIDLVTETLLSPLTQPPFKTKLQHVSFTKRVAESSPAAFMQLLKVNPVTQLELFIGPEPVIPSKDLSKHLESIQHFHLIIEDQWLHPSDFEDASYGPPKTASWIQQSLSGYIGHVRIDLPYLPLDVMLPFMNATCPSLDFLDIRDSHWSNHSRLTQQHDESINRDKDTSSLRDLGNHWMTFTKKKSQRLFIRFCGTLSLWDAKRGKLWEEPCNNKNNNNNSNNTSKDYDTYNNEISARDQWMRKFFPETMMH
jgi:hypothetical protein